MKLVAAGPNGVSRSGVSMPMSRTRSSEPPIVIAIVSPSLTRGSGNGPCNAVWGSNPCLKTRVCAPPASKSRITNALLCC